MTTEPSTLEVAVDEVAYSRLKILAYSIESAFKSHDFQEAKVLIAERQLVLDELGPNARLNEAQSKDLGTIEARIGWQVNQTRAEVETSFRRLARTKSVAQTYTGVGRSRLEQAG
jgi:hypothetical protein